MHHIPCTALVPPDTHAHTHRHRHTIAHGCHLFCLVECSGEIGHNTGGGKLDVFYKLLLISNVDVPVRDAVFEVVGHHATAHRHSHNGGRNHPVVVHRANPSR